MESHGLNRGVVWCGVVGAWKANSKITEMGKLVWK